MFKAMEERGLVPRAATERLAELCKGLITAAVTMVRGIGVEHVSRNLLDDLTLLTLGPQLRGGANVTKGKVGIKTVFKVIHDIVGYVKKLGFGSVEVVPSPLLGPAGNREFLAWMHAYGA